METAAWKKVGRCRPVSDFPLSNYPPVKIPCRWFLVLFAMLAASAAHALTLIYPIEAIDDLWQLPAEDFRQKYAGINISGIGPNDEGWYVRYKHENLTYMFGPLADMEAARKKKWELEAVRDAAIRNRANLSTSMVDYVKFTYSGVYGKGGGNTPFRGKAGKDGAGGEGENGDGKGGADGKDGNGSGSGKDGSGKDGDGKNGTGDKGGDGIGEGEKLAGIGGAGNGDGQGGKDGKGGKSGGKDGKNGSGGDGEDGSSGGQKGGAQKVASAKGGKGGAGGQGGQSGQQGGQSGQQGGQSGQQGGQSGSQGGSGGQSGGQSGQQGQGGQPGGGPSGGGQGGGGNPLQLLGSLLRAILGL